MWIWKRKSSRCKSRYKAMLPYDSRGLNSTRQLQGIRLYLPLTIDAIIAEANISACSHLSQAFWKILIIEFRRNGFNLIYELSFEYRVIGVRVSTTETNLVRASRCLIEQKISVRSWSARIRWICSKHLFGTRSLFIFQPWYRNDRPRNFDVYCECTYSFRGIHRDHLFAIFWTGRVPCR